jgi:hypothetical protein
MDCGLGVIRFKVIIYGFRVMGLMFGVKGLGFRVLGLLFMVWDPVSRVEGTELRI